MSFLLFQTTYDGYIKGLSGLGANLTTPITCDLLGTEQITTLLEKFFTLDEQQLDYLRNHISPELAGRPIFSSFFLQSVREIIANNYNSFQEACEKAIDGAFNLWVKKTGKFRLKKKTS